MAKNKKGFILYADQKELFEQLSNEQAGELIKHIYRYVNDENPVSDSALINIAFTPIKQQLKRDLEKFEQVREKRSLAGKASANKRKQISTNSTSVKSVKHRSTNSTDKENDNVNVNVTVTDKENDNVTDTVNDSSLKKEPKKLSYVSISEFPFKSDTFLNAWKEWLIHRKSIKKPYKTKKSELTALQKLARENVTEKNCLLSIETSIAGGYQGLFKHKENERRKSKHDSNREELTEFKRSLEQALGGE